MVDLTAILKKTEPKADKKYKRPVTVIASEDRPYDITPIHPSLEVNPNLTIPTSEIAKTQGKNRQQSGNKPTTNRQQTDDKPTTKWQQTGNTNIFSSENRQQTDNRTDNKVTTNRQQTDNKPTTQIVPVAEVVGLQKATLILLDYECKKARQRITPPLTLEYLSSQLKTTTGSVKTTLQRLESKGNILRVNHKNGRGGWSQYELSDQSYRELLLIESENRTLPSFEVENKETDNKPTTKWQQSGNKVTAEPTTAPPSSSYINNTTTTSDADFEKKNLPEEWGMIDVLPLQEIGFTQTHVMQLHKSGKLTPEEIQGSIKYFSFDLQNNSKGEKIKGSSLNYFMGILRSGAPYSPPENYESPEAKAMKLYVERTKKLRREEEAAKKETETFAFQEWVASLAEEEIDLYSAEYKSRKNDDPLKQGALRLHFNQNIWPKKLLEFSVCL